MSPNPQILKRNCIFVLMLFLGAALASQANVTVSVNVNLTGLGSVFKASNASNASNTSNNLVSANMNIECVRRFAPIISVLSADCQSRIIQVFKSNKATGRCCEAGTFVRSVRDCIRTDMNNFAKSMTSVAQTNKKSFSCFRAHQNFRIRNKDRPSKEDNERDNSNLRSLLLGYNNYTHLLSKCVVAMNYQTLSALSRMCLSNSTLPKFFRQDSQGQFTSMLKLKQDDLDLFNSCSPFLRSHSDFTGTLQNNYVDQQNFLVSVDQCNYFSDFFSFDIKEDVKDPFFPSSIVPAENPGSLNTLLGKWLVCASSNDKLNSTLVNALNASVSTAQTANPQGLATSVGRRFINIDAVKNIFYLEKYPSFHLSCQGGNCSAYCGNCDSLKLNSSEIILNGSAISTFDYSCCSGICVVSVLESNGLTGSEVFTVTGDIWSRKVDKLLLSKIDNANACFDYRRNATSSSNRTRSNLADEKLRANLNDLTTNFNNYNIDFRLGTALNLNVKPDGTNAVSLLNYLTNTLYANNRSFLLTCESGSCTYTVRNSNETKTFTLFANNTRIPAPAQNTTEQPAQPTSQRQRTRKEGNSQRSKQRNLQASEGPLSVNPTLQGYSANSIYPASSFKTNQQIGIRFNLFQNNLRSNLGNASAIIGYKKNTTRARTGIRIYTNRPTYYTAYNAGMKFNPSWGFYKSYGLPQYNFNFYRATNPVATPTPQTQQGSGKGPATQNQGQSGIRGDQGAKGSQVPPPPQNGAQTSTPSQKSGSAVPPPPAPQVSNNTTTNSTQTTNSTNSTRSNTTSNTTQATNTTSNTTTRSNTTSNTTTNATNGTVARTSFLAMFNTSANVTVNTSTRSANVTVVVNTNNTQNTTRSANTTQNHTASAQNTTHNGTQNQTRPPLPPQNGTQNQSHPPLPPQNGTQNQTRPHGPGHNQTNNGTHNGSRGNHSGPHFLKNNTQGGNSGSNRPKNKPKRPVSNAELKATFNPLDWVPTFRAPFDIQNYMSIVNSKLNQIKISVECCRLFCVTFIESFDDGINAASGQKRVFVDVNLRNYYAVDISDLSIDKKRCFAGNLWDGSVTSNWFGSCNISAPFKNFPIKDSCRRQLNDACKAVNFDTVVDRFSGTCDENKLCLNVNETSSESERLRCGAQIASRFMNNYGVRYSALFNPCDDQAVAPAQNRLTSLIQTHFMKRTSFAQTFQNATTNTSTSTNATSNATSSNTSLAANTTTSTNSTSNATRSSNTTTSNTTAAASNTSSAASNTTSNSSAASSNATSSASSNTSASTSNSSSPYVNEAALTPADKNDINSTQTAVKVDGTLVINIDSNTNLAPNTNVEADLNTINANGTNTSSGFFVALNGVLVILAFLLI